MKISRDSYRHLFGAAIIGGAMVIGANAAHAEKLTVIVGGMEKQIYLPAVLTEKLGYFKDEGLDVELINSRAGVDAENELLAGAAQAVVGFYDHTIDLQSKGKFIQSIVQFSQAPGEVELVSSKYADQIKSPADFKGHTLGVTGLGSSTDFLTQYLAMRNGLKQGDYTLLPVGAGNTFIAAFKQDAVQAGMTTEPTVANMLKSGDAKVLVDMRTPDKTIEALGGPYPAASFYVQSAWLETHKEDAQKLANALVKTMRYIASHSAEEIADQMPKDYYVGDKDLYVKGLAEGKAQYTPDGRMPKDGPETVLKVLATFKKPLQEKQVDLSKTFTTEFVDKANAALDAAK
ncbi:ABC transporter substrate-binding protein [Brucella sp. RRSP16]|uniref:NMT1/THI5-like protein n=2 Tax=Brucella/Ochrobactrum group TaxID=2826938 RepID=A0A292GRB4_9HYPH|nr:MULTISPECIES: ABC transporter substrate-binding protein [Brucella/Ochrobactrum group]BBA73291.1 NMT1/THI5-like protein [Ochrobactrum sp. PW1]KAB2717107.1 ABC transporter substrate-binding protein [Brucella intermedia]MBA8844234.1 NitT/TauT family transport system substrate-binding protein [Ochrobactrum sp. RH1CCR137]MBA8855887.1 NitT/TauT family transport system substrate-binding protein [Ochrobactrum sp. RH1CCR134]MCH6202611.1 ABC transporter substrate-binding protein [Brucella ciceri]